MTRALKRYLRTIDEMLVSPDGPELWRILTALRGPDQRGHDDLKWASTHLIRRVAFPKSAKKRVFLAAPRRSSTMRLPPILVGSTYELEHFLWHIYAAAVELDLEYIAGKLLLDPVTPLTKKEGM